MHARMISVVVFSAVRLQVAATAAGRCDGCRSIQPNSAQPSSVTHSYLRKTKKVAPNKKPPCTCTGAPARVIRSRGRILLRHPSSSSSSSSSSSLHGGRPLQRRRRQKGGQAPMRACIRRGYRTRRRSQCGAGGTSRQCGADRTPGCAPRYRARCRAEAATFQP